MIRRIATVAEMTAREIGRRRGVLVLMVLLPMAFYLVRRDTYIGQSIRFLLLGLAWAVSTAALFAAGTGRPVEARLRLSGYRGAHLCLGRLVALWGLGLALAAPFFAVIVVDHGDEVRLGPMAAAMALNVAVAAPFGLLVGALVPRDLEGTLLLIILVGVQMIADPAGTLAKAMPFWASREIGTYAVDHVGSDYLARGIAHGVLFTAITTIGVLGFTAYRLRHRAHLRFVSSR